MVDNNVGTDRLVSLKALTSLLTKGTDYCRQPPVLFASDIAAIGISLPMSLYLPNTE